MLSDPASRMLMHFASLKIPLKEHPLQVGIDWPCELDLADELSHVGATESMQRECWGSASRLNNSLRTRGRGCARASKGKELLNR